jgi:hypothetical protein
VLASAEAHITTGSSALISDCFLWRPPLKAKEVFDLGIIRMVCFFEFTTRPLGNDARTNTAALMP